MAKNEFDLLARAQVRQPVPSEDALDAHSEVFAVGLDRAQECTRRRGHVSVKHDFARAVQDAQVHRPGMKIDTAVVGMLPGVESHGSLRLDLSWKPKLRDFQIDATGAFISIPVMQTDVGFAAAADHPNR